MDGEGGLQHHGDTVGSRAEGNAWAGDEMGSRQEYAATPAPVHLRSGEGAGQAVRHGGRRLVQKGRRERREGSASVAAVWAASPHRSLRAGGPGGSARSG